MARLPRLVLPDRLHHILQRGNNSQALFASAVDYEMLLDLMRENAQKFDVALHAYVLMPDHFHLLATPKTAEGLPLMMQAVGRRYVRYFNDGQRRSGTLWEGRYRSTVLQAPRYLLACMAYFDLAPVREKLVLKPGDYGWSSYRHHAGQQRDPLLTPHPEYWTLGNTPFEREAAYIALVERGLGTEMLGLLTTSVLTGWVLGDGEFIAALKQQTARRLEKASPGRPKASKKSGIPKA